MLSILKAGAPAPAPAFSPSSLNPILWLDAQTASTLLTGTTGSETIASNTNRVTSWVSRAAGGSATETADARPTLNTTAFGAGKPGVVFSGSRLVLESFTALGGATAFTIAMVMRSPLDANAAVFGPRDGYAGGVELVDLAPSQFFRVNGAQLNAANAASITSNGGIWSANNATAVSVLSFSASSSLSTDDGTIAAWKDGTLVQSQNVISGPVNTSSGFGFNGIYSLGNYNFGLNPKAMTMGEFIIIDRVLTTNERTSLETYLSTRWA